MPRFFVNDLGGDTARITGPDALHLAKVHRAKQGELFTLCDGKGTDYIHETQSVASDCVVFRVISSSPSASEPTVAVTYQALPKGDKFDFICEERWSWGWPASSPSSPTGASPAPISRVLKEAGAL